MIQRVFFDLGLTLAESDVPQGYVEHFARLGHPGFPGGGAAGLPSGQQVLYAGAPGRSGQGQQGGPAGLPRAGLPRAGHPPAGGRPFPPDPGGPPPGPLERFPLFLGGPAGPAGAGDSHGPGVQLGYLLQERAGADRFGPPTWTPLWCPARGAWKSRTAASSRRPWNFPGTPRNIASMWGTIITMTAWAPLRWGWSSAFSIPLGSWA